MKRFAVSLIILSVMAGLQSVASAQYTSPNYRAEEAFFGSGGELESTSPSFKAQSSLGSLGVATFNGTTYQAYSGFLTPNEPFLEMTVGTSLVDLGVLDSLSAKTGTSSFMVRAYTNSGYTVRSLGGPLTSGPHTIDPMASQGASVAGTEQFGINLKSNTAPATFGADPSKQPDASFADGQAAAGYDTANQFKYGTGDTIAQSNTSGWGLTVFTISYMANISSITEAGSYSMTHDLVVIPIY